MHKALIAVLVMLAAPPAALACDCVRWLPGPHFEVDIDRVIAGSSAIIDAVVVKPMASDGQPAVVTASHVWKGPKQRQFSVGLGSDCSTVLDAKLVRPGQRIRLILFGGPEFFEASRCTNFQSPVFDRAVDTRLKRLRLAN
jgi:hypothetical protein